MGVLKELMRSRNPSEVAALLRYAKKAKNARSQLTASLQDSHWRYAYDALCNVSRSFALVIMQLEPDLRHPVCVFYLVLRALDTVEDDTTCDSRLRQEICKEFWTYLPCPSTNPCSPSSFASSASSASMPKRFPRLSSDAPTPKSVSQASCKVIDEIDDDKVMHHENHENGFPIIYCTEEITNVAGSQALQPFKPWSSSQFGKGAEKELCERFPEVTQCYSELKDEFKIVIRDITRRMGYGMASHIHDVSCESTDDYNLYCHYVAGLVGYGLTDIFVWSGRELPCLATNPSMSNSMGLFLQKVNIIRDYLEDIEEGRTFWPKQIWSCYASSLEAVKSQDNSLHALNHMVTDALHQVPKCLEYMSSIRSGDVFNFVAIPQVMAIATLNILYNNQAVFKGVVKLRRPQTAYLVLKTTDMKAVYAIFYQMAREMMMKVPLSDPNSNVTRTLLSRIVELCVPHVPSAPNLIIPNVVSIVLFSVLSSYVLKRRQEHFDGAVFTWRSAGGIMEPLDMLAVGALFLVCMYMFAFFLLPYMSRLQQDDWHRLVNGGARPVTVKH